MGKRSRGVAARKETPAYELDPRFVGGVDLIRRTGARTIQVRYADDEQPVVWFVVATYENHQRFDAAAAATPLKAMMRLCAELIDGGTCRHCGQPTIFDEDFETDWTKFLPHSCTYAWDPELEKFCRSCEGET